MASNRLKLIIGGLCFVGFVLGYLNALDMRASGVALINGAEFVMGLVGSCAVLLFATLFYFMPASVLKDARSLDITWEEFNGACNPFRVDVRNAILAALYAYLGYVVTGGSVVGVLLGLAMSIYTTLFLDFSMYIATKHRDDKRK